MAVTAYAEVNQNIRNGDYPVYSRYEFEVKKLFPSESKRAILVMRADLQATLGNQVPFFEQSSLGGQNNLRGYGVDRFIDKNLVARVSKSVFIWSGRRSPASTADFEFAPFLDTGQVFNSFKDVSFKDYRMTPGIGFRGIVKPNVVGRIDYGFSQGGWCGLCRTRLPLLTAARVHRWRRDGAAPGRSRRTPRLRFLSPSVSSSGGRVRSVSGQKLPPAPAVGIEYAGDRAAVLKPGYAGRASGTCRKPPVSSTNSPQIHVTVKFETLRSGLFLRYGATEKLELGLEVPVLYRYQGFMYGAIMRARTGNDRVGAGASALKNANYVFNVTRNGQTIMNGGHGALGLGDRH